MKEKDSYEAYFCANELILVSDTEEFNGFE